MCEKQSFLGELLHHYPISSCLLQFYILSTSYVVNIRKCQNIENTGPNCLKHHYRENSGHFVSIIERINFPATPRLSSIEDWWNLFHYHFNTAFIEVFIFSGPIPADIRFVPKDLDFGGQINCIPSQLHLKPSEHKAFTLQFYSQKDGKFIEDVHFMILNSNEILKFVIT